MKLKVGIVAWQQRNLLLVPSSTKLGRTALEEEC